MSSPKKEKRETEQRLAASKKLDQMAAYEIVRLMNSEDRKVAAAIARKLPAIARAIDAMVGAIRKGGRLFYVGAGTSGRLGVLDAAECPPTFGISPTLVQALIAGGKRAITQAVEGAEDSAANGQRDLRRLRLSKKDVVVGIAASGTTPYVVGALKYARGLGAMTVALTSNLRVPVGRIAKIVIAPEVGPEVLTGSTRLKAGTSQKMVLNMLSTGVMVRLGHAYENLMIDMMLTNDKLGDRALRILAAASGKNVSTAKHALSAAGHSMRVALVMLNLNVSAPEARKRLNAAHGNLRAVLANKNILKRRAQKTANG